MNHEEKDDGDLDSKQIYAERPLTDGGEAQLRSYQMGGQQ